MSLFDRAKRLGALAFAIGAAIAGPTAAGVASAARDEVAPNLAPSNPGPAALPDTEMSRITTAALDDPISPVVLGWTDDGRLIGFLATNDPESGDISYTLAQSPQLGSIQFDSSGTWTYTPGEDFIDTDSFYVIMDDPGLDHLAHVFSNSALVEVEITTPSFH
jgi:hypothetical protein